MPAASSDTPSRKKIFICRPAAGADEIPCAKKILATLARQAYRRPVTDRDTEQLLSFYQTGKNEGETFDAGIEAALQLILASPEFLFRFEPDPANVAAGTPIRSTISNWRRGFRSSCGAAFPTKSCSTSPAPAS